MEQNLGRDIYMKEDFSERVVNIQKEKSNKCSLCDFASSQAGNLKRHLKTHGGEKSNKCNQCDYSSIRVSDLRTHLKTPEFIFVGTGGTGGRVKFLLTA